MFRRSIALLLSLLLAVPATAAAQDVPDSAKSVEPAKPGAGSKEAIPDEFLPLSASFSYLEVGTTVAVGVTGGAIGYWGQDIIGLPKPSMGPPVEGSFDLELSQWANPNPDPNDHWGGPLPNLVGNPLVIVIPTAFYLAGAAETWFLDTNLLPDTRHELLAWAGAISWTMFIVQTSKFLFGRLRPYAVRDDIENPEAWQEKERSPPLSFPSGHAAAMGVAMSFLYLDFTDWLVFEVFDGQDDWLAFTLGRVLPFIAATGTALAVSYSRVRDMQHWPSDIIVGSAIGGAFGGLFYDRHFDAAGNPRLRFGGIDQGDAADGPFSSLQTSPWIHRDGIGVGVGLTW